MAVYYVASIAPAAYPAFCELSDGRLPEAFGDWRAAEDLARRDLVARGDHVVGLPVELAGFRDHCRAMNCRADAVALTIFATRIGNKRFGTDESYEGVRVRTVIVDDTRAEPVVVEDARAPVIVDDAPARRHWWQFGRRPKSRERTRPLAARAA